MSEKATPRPWRRHEDRKDRICTSAGAVLAQTLWCRTISDDERNANADLIVTAVNSHDNLIELCEQAALELDEITSFEPANWIERIDAMVEKIEEVLAKIKEA